MAKPLVDDTLWELIEPLLPPRQPRRRRYPGRKRLDDRKALAGILFVLRSGIPWEMLPQEMGCGSGMTCWRRLRQWQQAGVWQRLHEALLAKLQAADAMDGSGAGVDSSAVRAVGGGGENGAQPHRPPQAGQQASRHHRWARPSPGGPLDRSQPA